MQRQEFDIEFEFKKNIFKQIIEEKKKSQMDSQYCNIKLPQNLFDIITRDQSIDQQQQALHGYGQIQQKIINKKRQAGIYYTKKFQQLIKGNMTQQQYDQVPEEYINELKLLMIMSSKYLSLTSIQQMSDDQYIKLSIQNEIHKKYLIKCLQQLIEEQLNPILDQFLNKINPAYQEQFEEQVIEKFKEFMLKRNIYYKQLLQKLTIVENQNLKLLIDKIYDNVSSQQVKQIPKQPPKLQKKQSQPQFIQRIFKQLFANCQRVLKKNIKRTLIDASCKKLYDLMDNLPIKKSDVVNILTNCRLDQYKNQQVITVQLINKIYKSSYNADDLQSGEKIEPANITPNPQIKPVIKNNPNDVSPVKSGIESSSKKIIQNCSNSSQKIVSNKKIQKQDIQVQNKEQLNQLSEQIGLIYKKTKTNNCFQIVLRQLSRGIHTKNLQKVKQNSNKLISMVQKYDINNISIKAIEELSFDSININEKISTVNQLRRKIECLNIQYIIRIKSFIESDKNCKQCENKNAFILIGKSGVGKSTCLVGISGHKLQFKEETGDFRPQDRKISQQYKISNRMISETRWANISTLPSAVSSQTIYIIDTAGLGDNRGPQTDITNNIGTIHLIHKLQSFRILIVVSQKQLSDRPFFSIIQFVKLIAAYLSDFHQVKNCIHFVLTKGLNFSKFKALFKEFNIEQNKAKIYWNTNQTEVLQFILDFLEDNFPGRKFEIQDPSTYKFKDMSRDVLRQNKTLCLNPKNYFSQSYSDEARQAIKNVQIYLQKMVQKTLKYQQFQLTQYYYEKIRLLQSFYTETNILQRCQVLIKLKILQKIGEFDNSLNYYMQTKMEANLIQILNLREYFRKINQVPIFIQKIFKGQNSPFQRISKSLQVTIGQYEKLFDKPSEIVKKNKRNSSLAALQLMKNIKPDSFIKIKNKVHDLKKKHQTDIRSFLQNNRFSKQKCKNQWDQIVEDANNQFSFDDYQTLHDQNLRNLQIKVRKYYQSDPQPQQMIQFEKFINMAKKGESLDGQFSKFSKIFFGKLQMIKSSHNIFIQFMDKLIKQYLKKLTDLIAEFQETKLKGLGNLSQHQVALWQIIDCNSNEIHQILETYDTSNLIRIQYQKRTQSTLKLVQLQLKTTTQLLNKQMNNLTQDIQNLKVDKLVQYLNTILSLDSFIRKKQKVFQQQYKALKDQQMSQKRTEELKIFQKKSKFINQIQEKASESLQKMIKKIQNISKNSIIFNYQINYNLIVCLIVLKQIKSLFSNDQYKNIIQKILVIQGQILEKLLKPQNQIDAFIFQHDHQFKKFFKIMKFIHKLSLECKRISSKSNAQNFNFNVQFLQNNKIRSALKKSFQKLENDYKKVQKLNRVINYQQQMQYKMQIQSLQRDNKYDQKNKTQVIINSLSLDTLKDATLYIEKYDLLEKIINYQQFQILDCIQNYKNIFQKNNLKRQIIKRIEQLFTKIDSIQNQYTREQILNLEKQLKLMINIYQKVTYQMNLDYNQRFLKLKQLSYKLIKGFEDRVNLAFNDYKNTIDGVDFTTLKELIKDQATTAPANKDKLLKLITHIDKQYKERIKDYFIQISTTKNTQKILTKINVFININEFIQICEKSLDPPYQYTFQTSLLQQTCIKFFIELYDNFKSLIDGISKGISPNMPQVQQLISYERKILMSLNQQYTSFLKSDYMKGKNNNMSNLQIWFQEQKNKRLKNIQEQYVQKFDLNKLKDDKQLQYRQIYDNSSLSVKQKIQKSAKKQIKKLQQNLKQLIKSDIEQFNKNIQTTEILLDKFPQILRKELSQTIINLKTNQREYIQKQKKIIDDIILKKDPKQFFKQFIKAKNKKSQQIKNITLKGFTKYFNKQKQQMIKFINEYLYDKLQENLNTNIVLYDSKQFQEIRSIQSQFQGPYEQYIYACKSIFASKIKYIQNQFTKIVNVKIKNNLSKATDFKIQDIEIQKQDLEKIKKAYQLLKFMLKFKIFFNIQLDTLINSIKNSKQILTINIINFLQQLNLIQTKLLQNILVDKEKFIQLLAKSKQTLQIYKIFKIFKDTIQIRIQTAQTFIQQYKEIIENIKQILYQKYINAQQFDLNQLLGNDSFERVKQRNKEIEKNILLVKNFIHLFYPIDQVPAKFLQQIQTSNKSKFDQFEKQVLNQIQESFETYQETQSDKVRKFYDFMKLSKQVSLKTFPQNFLITDKVKKQLIKKFKAKIASIESFVDNKDKQYQYKKMVETVRDLQKQGQRQKKELQLTIKNETLKIQNQYQKLQQDRKKAISIDQPNRTQLIANIQKRILRQKQQKIHTMIFNKNVQLDKKSTIRIQQITQLNEKIEKFLNQIKKNLIIFSKVKICYNCDQDIHKNQIKAQNFLQTLQKNYRCSILKYMHKLLFDFDNPWSQKLAHQEKCFAKFNFKTFAENTKGATFQVLLSKMSDIVNDLNKKNILLQNYNQNQKQYNKNLDQYQKSNDRIKVIQQLTRKCKTLGTEIEKCYQKKRNLNYRQRLELITSILSLWTILKSQIDEQDGNVIFVQKPHPGQILSIFLLLQLDDDRQNYQIEKCIIQVSTGQGKSVILAIISTYLALIGFTIYQACYSKYLSERDYKSFQDLFLKLGLKDKIKYDVFSEICRMILDQNSEKTFSNKVRNFILQQKKQKGFLQKIYSGKQEPIFSHSKMKKSILLIDQADVFLDEKFLGQKYCPSISIVKDSVKKLLDLVWMYKEKANELQPNTIINSSQFKQLCQQIPNKTFQQIMSNQVNGMIRGLANYKQDAYVLSNGKIFYKQGDGLSSKIHHGYRTIFSYYQENQNGRVTPNQLDKQIFINLICACFSYSKLPTYFPSILGVTGTLDSMSKPQKDLLYDQFKVRKQYIQPSIYQKSKRKVQFKKVHNLRLFTQIVENINLLIPSKRPILIFFNGKNQIYDFYDSPAFSNFKQNSSIVTYQNNPEQRDYRIQIASENGRITLLTVDFSRGTDFKLKVKNANQHPGIHVISAFLPKSYSDYIQLVGRTGRQGKNGSALIFISQDKQISQQQSHIEKQDAQKLIKNSDETYWRQKAIQIKQKINSANLIHDKNLGIYKISPTLESILTNLKQLNNQPEICKKICKTAICIDGTGSMNKVLIKMKNVIKDAIPNIYKAIQNAKVNGSYEIKLVVYRNYDSTYSKLLEYSNFETKAEPLLQWISKIRAEGGWGNQAVQVCLQHLNSLQEIHQFVIIADAPANNQAETGYKRDGKQGRGQKYWNKNGFPKTSFKEQMSKIKSKGIKGHSYFIKNSVFKNYQFYSEMSKQTGGVVEQLDITDSKATQNFTDFLASRILESLGGMIGGKAAQSLLECYNTARYV